MVDNKLRIIPLGGLGEIGRNCTVLEYGDDILVIDAGLMFPEEEMLGVDYVIPDFQYLVERRERVRGIVITHGHEDHIGGLSYLLKEVQAPIFATPLTRGLIEARLKGRGVKDAQLHTVLPGQEIKLGAFAIQPYHTNHSIPDAVGLGIRTPLGLIVHTGDFKIDHTPVDGKAIDLSALARLANEGVLLLMADSTNAESAGFTPSEARLVDSFQRVLTHAKGRVIVATFASLLSRIQLFLDIAAQFGRKVAIVGRSMEENVAIAEELGYIRFPANTRVPAHQIESLPDEEILVLATGSQGEANAVLGRMAMGRFRFLKVREGDTVVLSSKAIPGNETAVYRNIDKLFQQGANVIYGEQGGMHVSGHAAQEELKLILNLLRPLYFMPVHGEYRMLHQHAHLAADLGYQPEDVFIGANGRVVELSAAGAQWGEELDLNEVYVDGSLVGDVGQTVLRDRLALSQDGFVIARVGLEWRDGNLMADPEIISQGFVWMPGSTELIQSAESAIMETIANANGSSGDMEELSRRVKRRLEDLFYEETRRRPVIIPVIGQLQPVPQPQEQY